MLRHIAAAAIHVHIFFSLFGCLCEKKWSQEKSTENPSDILRFPFFIRDSLRAHGRYGLNFSLRAVFFFFFILFREKKYKNSEPVTCAWASTVPFHAVSQYIRNCFKKSTLSHFLKLTLRAQLFSREKKNKKKHTAHFFKKPWASTRVLRKHDGPERARW